MAFNRTSASASSNHRQWLGIPIRIWMLGAGLVLTLFLVITAPRDDVPQDNQGTIYIHHSAVTSRPSANAYSASGATAEQNAALISQKQTGLSTEEKLRALAWVLRHAFPVQTIDAFHTLTYAPPPPPPAPIKPVFIAPPPKPVAPPLPFQYLGTMGGHHAVQKGDDIFEVIPGHTLTPEYRVEEIKGDQATLTYLPLNEKQTLLLKAHDE